MERALVAKLLSWGRNTIPTPNLHSGSCRISIFRSANQGANNSQGIAVIIPAPSPESWSALQPPRCSKQVKAGNAF